MFGSDDIWLPSCEMDELERDGFDQAFGYVVGDFARRKVQQEYARDMAKWAWDKLGVMFHDKQNEVARSLIEHKNTAVAAGHGTGKSFQAAIAAAWWVDTHPLGSAYVATTAPSVDQISEIIFRELKRIQQMSMERAEKGVIPKDWVIPGRIGEDNTWKIERGGRSVTVMKGRKPPDNKAGDAFQGLHARYVLAIGDEATGLSEEMIDGLANITSNDTSRRMLISNPTNPFSPLGKIFLNKTGAWNLIHVSVLDLPTFHGGGRCDCHPDEKYGLGFPKEVLEQLSGPTFVEDKKLEYGEGSPRYISRVLGQFAFEAGSNLFNDLDLATASDAVVEPDFAIRPVLGVDVARMGGDSTVVYRVDEGIVMRRRWAEGVDDGKELPREPAIGDDGEYIRGKRLRFVESWRDVPLVTRHLADGTEIMGTAERVHELAMSLGAREVRVDAGGFGVSVTDRLWELRYRAGADYQIVEMNSGAPPPDRRAHYNNRAFQYDNFRKGCLHGTIDIDGSDEKLLDELMGIEYDFADGSLGGGLKIESKESMKRKGKKSPDFADAAWIALADLSHLDDHEPGDLVRTDLDAVIEGSGREWWMDEIW